MSDVPPGDLDEISLEECLELLRGEEVGRLAVVVDRQPVIFPVNYRLDGQVVVFRNDPGTKLTNASLDRVAFEVDVIDRERHEGWSVVVQGVGREFTGALDPASVRERSGGLTPWVSGDKEHWVRIVNSRITGRRIRHGRP